MDHVKILKRAWAILWQYRVLWIFGIILALATSSGSSGSNTSFYNFNRDDINNSREIFPPGDLPDEIRQFFQSLEGSPDWSFSAELGGTIVALLIGLACVVFLLIVIGIIARNVAEAALLKLVDEYEETGEKRTFREGFRMGWSKTAVRLFLINIMTAIPVILVVILLGALVIAPLFLWTSGDTVTGVFGTITSIGLGFITVILFIVLAVAVKTLLRFVRRASALENLGVVDAFKQGYSLLRKNLGPIFLMWLIMLGVQLGSTLLMIPLVFLSLAVSGVISGILLLIVRGITGLFLSGAAMWITAGVVALPAFIFLLSLPLAFVGGLIKVYESSVWTLTYRELTALKTIGEDTDENVLTEDSVDDEGIVELESSDMEEQV